MIRLIVTVFALLMFVVGAILAPTPIPIGLAMMAIATFILVANNKWAADWVRGARRRWRLLDHWMRVLESKLSGRMLEVLSRTRPANGDPEADRNGR